MCTIAGASGRSISVPQQPTIQSGSIKQSYVHALVELFFHCNPECAVNRIEVGFRLSRGSIRGDLFVDSCLQTEVFYGSDSALGGWYTPVQRDQSLLYPPLSGKGRRGYNTCENLADLGRIKFSLEIIMGAIQEIKSWRIYRKVTGKHITVELPEEHDFEEVEIIIIPRQKSITSEINSEDKWKNDFLSISQWDITEENVRMDSWNITEI